MLTEGLAEEAGNLRDGILRNKHQIPGPQMGILFQAGLLQHFF